MGLLGTVARTTVIAGTATAVSNGVSRRQANRWAEQEAPQQPVQQAPVAAPATGEQDTISQLKELGELKQQGILTDAEFEAQKAKILAG